MTFFLTPDPRADSKKAIFIFLFFCFLIPPSVPRRPSTRVMARQKSPRGGGGLEKGAHTTPTPTPSTRGGVARWLVGASSLVHLWSLPKKPPEISRNPTNAVVFRAWGARRGSGGCATRGGTHVPRSASDEGQVALTPLTRFDRGYWDKTHPPPGAEHAVGARCCTTSTAPDATGAPWAPRVLGKRRPRGRPRATTSPAVCEGPVRRVMY